MEEDTHDNAGTIAALDEEGVAEECGQDESTGHELKMFVSIRLLFLSQSDSKDGNKVQQSFGKKRNLLQ